MQHMGLHDPNRPLPKVGGLEMGDFLEGLSQMKKKIDLEVESNLLAWGIILKLPALCVIIGKMYTGSTS